MGSASRRAPAWRTSCVALCLLPVVLPLLLLCLPLLCVAVAVARFRRCRRRLLLLRRRRCCPGERSEGEDAEGRHRADAALLHKYLEDQMELVGADAGAGETSTAPAVLAVDPTPSSQRRHPQLPYRGPLWGLRRRSSSADWAQETELDLNI